jgi:predicted permease
VTGDVRQALRALRRAPGVAAVAALSLALAIAANASAFSIVSSLLLRPLPVQEPGRLVALFGVREGSPPSILSWPDILDYRSLDVFEGVAAHNGIQVAVGGPGRPEMAWGEIVTDDYFDVVGVRPALGRLFTDREGVGAGGTSAVVLAHDFWRRRFAADPDVLGRTVRLNGRPYTVVGVTPRGFTGTRLFAFAPDVFVPLAAHEAIRPSTAGSLERRDARWLFAVARLRSGATLTEAGEAAGALARALAAEHPDSNRGLGVRVLENRAPINPWVLEPGTTRRMAALLLLAMLLVLLIACANVANLLLARATARRREIAVRVALGAGRGRLVRQLLVESLVLAALGGGLGLLLAAWLVDLSSSFTPTLDFRTAFDLRVDARVVAFTAAATVATGLLFGLLPALRASRPRLVPALRDAVEDGRGAGRLRQGLVVAQVALSLVLLTGAGLFVRSFEKARGLDPGFDPRGALRANVDLEPAGYDEARRREFHRRLLERARELPGVRSAALAFPLPLDAYSSGWEIVVEGRERSPDAEDPLVFGSTVSSGYFETLRTPIVRGRALDERDREDSPPAAVVNETFARRFWPGEEALGRRFSVDGTAGPWIEVVGVARDGKYLTLGEAPRPYLFLPLAQRPISRVSVVARTEGDPDALVPALRAAVAALDPDLPVFGEKTLRQHMETPLSGFESGAATVGFFGVMALLLAATGVYGVVAYGAARRTREMGIRMALGARAADVLRLIVGGGARMAGAGMAIGLAGALLLSRSLTGLLHGVSAADPATYATVAAVVLAAALLASWVPARRATRVNPSLALRSE